MHTINKSYCQVTAQLDAKSLAQQRQRVVHCKTTNSQYSQEQWDVFPDVSLSSCNGLVVFGLPFLSIPSYFLCNARTAFTQTSTSGVQVLTDFLYGGVAAAAEAFSADIPPFTRCLATRHTSGS